MRRSTEANSKILPCAYEVSRIWRCRNLAPRGPSERRSRDQGAEQCEVQFHTVESAADTDTQHPHKQHCIVYYRTQWTAEGSVFGAASLLVFVYEISREPLNGFAPKFTWKSCLVPCSDEFKGQDQRSIAKVTRDTNGIFGPFRRPACGLCLLKHL